MTDITLVKTEKGLLGFTQADQKAWLEFKAMIEGMGEGEYLALEYRRPRIGWMHRKFFAMLNHGFEHWETGRKRKTYKGMPVEKNFENFRKDVIILAGYYTQSFDLKGRLVLEAKSISFAKMEQDEFEKLYDSVANVLLEQVLTNYKRADLDKVVAELMDFTHGAPQ